MKTSHARVERRPPFRASASRAGHDRRGNHRAGAGRRGRRHDLRLQRRRDPADVRRDLSLQRAQSKAADGGRPMPLIVPANEQGAGFMAAGYARASGKVGVCVVTSGPGATNTVTPVRDCAADSVPIVVICGQVGTVRDRLGRVPGSARRQHHGCRRETLLPRDRCDEARGDGAHGVRNRAHWPAGSRRHRHPQGRAELAGDLPGRRPSATSAAISTAWMRWTQRAERRARGGVVGHARARASAR